MNDVEPVEQVLAELPLVDQVAQVAVGRGDDPHVDAARRALGADLLQLAGLEEAQQQALHAQRHLADFVEEDRARCGHLELAGLVAIGAGEAALDVAEQLRLEQRFGQAGAVDGDEVVALARPVGVNRPRDELLADAALAGDRAPSRRTWRRAATSWRSSSIRAGSCQRAAGDSPTLIRMRSLSLGWRQFQEQLQAPDDCRRRAAGTRHRLRTGTVRGIAVRGRLQQTRIGQLNASPPSVARTDAVRPDFDADTAT